MEARSGSAYSWCLGRLEPEEVEPRRSQRRCSRLREPGLMRVRAEGRQPLDRGGRQLTCGSESRAAYWRALRASARGSGPGCLPDGRGTGFCASGAKFDRRLDDRVDQLAATCRPAPAAHASASATHSIGSRSPGRWSNTSGGSGGATAERWCGGPRDRPGGSRCTRCGTASAWSARRCVAEAGVPGGELGDAVATMANHDQHADRPPRLGSGRGAGVPSTRCGSAPARRRREPAPSTATRSGARWLRLDEHAGHEVALTADRLVDERVGERQPLHGSRFSMSPMPWATAWSAAAKAWA